LEQEVCKDCKEKLKGMECGLMLTAEARPQISHEQTLKTLSKFIVSPNWDLTDILTFTNCEIFITIFSIVSILVSYSAYVVINKEETTIIVEKNTKYSNVKSEINKSKNSENILNNVKIPVIESDKCDIYLSDEM
jgi:hypothetical protein